MLKKIAAGLLAVILLLGLVCCGSNLFAVESTSAPPVLEMGEAAAAPTPSVQEKPEVAIVYTSDIHASILNSTKDSNGNVVPLLRLSSVAGLKQDLLNEGKQVLLVDAGDEIQGSVFGLVDMGETVIQLMNAAGYDLACPGNHAFDYGLARAEAVMKEAAFPYISSSFCALPEKNPVLPQTKIFDLGGVRVAFVGISSPETIESAARTIFQNDKGEYLYTFLGQDQPQDLFDAVQCAIDSVRSQADYVIALSHLGLANTAYNKGFSSEDLIAHTTGLDAYIDGHAHLLLQQKTFPDSTGKDVLLTSPGYSLNAVGILTISPEGQIQTELLNEYPGSSSAVAELEEKKYQTVMDSLGSTIAKVRSPLVIMDPEDEARRLIRSEETNLGDFLADAKYWYFNEYLQIPCDIALINGGGIRAQVLDSDISFMDIMSILPFDNQVSMIRATGQHLLDALESGVSVLGTINSKTGAPEESGGFLHVAGMRYCVDLSVPSSVEKTSDDSFVAVSGKYRVHDVEIYNRSTGTYEPIDLEKEYSVASADFLLTKNGSGLTMFSGDPVIASTVNKDSLIVSSYAESFQREGEYPLICTEGSPLASYSGYLIDYDNPHGSGRIQIKGTAG